MEDVAKNGSIKDRFNLRDAVKGEIEVKLEWYQVNRDAADVAAEEERAKMRKAAFEAEYDALEAERTAKDDVYANRPLMRRMRDAKEAKTKGQEEEGAQE